MWQKAFRGGVVNGGLIKSGAGGGLDPPPGVQISYVRHDGSPQQDGSLAPPQCRAVRSHPPGSTPAVGHID
eukprot:8152384-Pyramimonas_sp.AAC.2